MRYPSDTMVKQKDVSEDNNCLNCMEFGVGKEFIC
jgi:hypothetical protein